MKTWGRLLFIIGMVCLPFRASAQTPAGALEWNTRCLTLSDYISSEAYSGSVSNTSIQWSVSSRPFYPSGKRWQEIKYTDIKNNFLPKESWIREDASTPSKLKYEQLKFDISEFYCRKVEFEANHHGNLDQIMNRYRDSLATAISYLSELTGDGEDECAVDSIKTVVSNRLSGISMPYSDITVPVKGGISLGFSMFEQYLFRIGGTADLLPSPLPWLSSELSVGYDRFSLSAGWSYQQTNDWLKSKESFTYNNQFYHEGANCEDSRYYGLLEYTAVEKPRFQLRPFIGGGIIHMSFLPRENLESFSCPLFMAGVNVDYCLYSIWDLRKRNLTSFLLRGRVYVSKERIADYSGYSVCIGIGLSPCYSKTR